MSERDVTPVLPVITIYRNGVTEQKYVYRPSSKYNTMFARWLCRDAKIGTKILYDRINNLEYEKHCLDFIIKRTENGWQPYVSSYCMDDRPLDHHFDVSDYLCKWKKAEKRSEKIEINKKVSDELKTVDVM